MTETTSTQSHREGKKGCRNLYAEKQHDVPTEKCLWPELIPHGGGEMHAQTHTHTHNLLAKAMSCIRSVLL